MKRGHRPTFVAAGIVLAGGVALRLGLKVLSLPSEITTLLLLVLLAVLVLVGWVIVMGVRWAVKPPHHRLGFAGANLLIIGTVLAVSILPDSPGGASPGGAVGVLPPFPPRQGRGFDVALLARPESCESSVPVTIVANGSSAYWKEHARRLKTRLPFVIVLPGRYGKIDVELGPAHSAGVGDPRQAVPDRTAKHQIKYEVKRPGDLGDPHEQTIIIGKVLGWSGTDRPLIIRTSARWMTHRGLNDCNLQLPKLSGEASAAAVVNAFTCGVLARQYARRICSEPDRGEQAGTEMQRVSPMLEVRRALTMVTGSDVSDSASVPEPQVIEGVPRWRCSATRGRGLLRIAAGAETGPGEGGDDCHALATVLSSTWQRDFVLALIGAFVAVGVHLLFQARAEEDPDQAPVEEA